MHYLRSKNLEKTIGALILAASLTFLGDMLSAAVPWLAHLSIRHSLFLFLNTLTVIWLLRWSHGRRGVFWIASGAILMAAAGCVWIRLGRIAKTAGGEAWNSVTVFLIGSLVAASLCIFIGRRIQNSR